MVTSEGTLRTLDSILTTEGKHVSTMTAPIGRHIGVRSESVRDSVIDFFLVSLAICVRLADTLRHNLRITFLVAGIPTILALISFTSEQEFLTQGTHDGLVELALYEFVTIHFVDIALSHTNGTLSAKGFVRTTRTSHRILYKIHSQ